MTITEQPPTTVADDAGSVAPSPGRRWSWFVALGAAVVLAVVMLVLARNASTDRTAAEHRLADRERALATETADLAAMRALVTELETEARILEEERLASAAVVDANQASLDVAQTELDGARLTLAGADARLVATRTCLTGARRALDATVFGDSNRAVVELHAVTAACRQALSRRDGDTPVYAFDFADPFVMRVGTTMYAFATNAGGGSVQVLRSADGTSWAPVGSALARHPAWARAGTTWAPAVLPRPGGFVLYYATREASTNRQCLSSAFATNPAGPYVDDTAGPLECGSSGAIDPSPFVAADGTPYLLWKQEPNRIMGQALTPDGRSLVGERRTLLTPSRKWDGGNVEAPSMLVAGNRYWLFYSANHWNGRDYAQGLAACLGPLGPCRADPFPFISSHDDVAGPGGGEAFVDPQGQWRLAYHAYREPLVGYPNSRLLHIAPLTLDLSGRPAIR